MQMALLCRQGPTGERWITLEESGRTSADQPPRRGHVGGVRAGAVPRQGRRQVEYVSLTTDLSRHMICAVNSNGQRVPQILCCMWGHYRWALPTDTCTRLRTLRTRRAPGCTTPYRPQIGSKAILLQLRSCNAANRIVPRCPCLVRILGGPGDPAPCLGLVLKPQTGAPIIQASPIDLPFTVTVASARPVSSSVVP